MGMIINAEIPKDARMLVSGKNTQGAANTNNNMNNIRCLVFS